MIEVKKEGTDEKTEALSSEPTNQLDTGTALQVFLDRIPISSIPGLQNSLPVVELKTGDSVRDDIHFLHEKNMFRAPMADALGPSDSIDPYVVYIDFASMILWVLQEIQKAERDGNCKTGNQGISSVLEQNPHVGQTKVGELAKLFMWGPFFPIALDDSLMHALLLLSTHMLQILPVKEQSNSKVMGFVTQTRLFPNFCIEHPPFRFPGMLCGSSPLSISSPFSRLEHKDYAVHVYGDQNISEAFSLLWENGNCPAAVRNRENRRLIGGLRSSDVHLLLDNNDLFCSRKTQTVEEFIHLDARKTQADVATEGDLGDLASSGVLRLRNTFFRGWTCQSLTGKLILSSKP